MADRPFEGQPNVYLAWARAVSWYIYYPLARLLYYLAVVLFLLLKVLYRPLAFILQPVVYLAHFVVKCIAAPFRFLARLETLYIYLGVAAVIGLLGGLSISYIYIHLQKQLGLGSSAEAEHPVRTPRQYRQAKRKEKAELEVPILTPGVLSPGILSPRALSPGHLSMSDGTRKRRRGRGLFNQTILEEMDSDY